MGADGGTIPRRDELVKEKKKPEKVIVMSDIHVHRCYNYARCVHERR